MSMRTTLTSNSYHSSKFTVLIVVAFTKKGVRHTQGKKTEQQAEQAHNLLVSILVFVREYTYQIICSAYD